MYNIYTIILFHLTGEAPVLLKRPSVLRVAEGQSFDFLVMRQKAVLSDANDYRCHAKNSYGEVEASGTVIVRRKTWIVLRPQDIEEGGSVAPVENTDKAIVLPIFANKAYSHLAKFEINSFVDDIFQ
ncbi:hypothetical protein Btru_069996 [Bulinus truncatus]|nr:hypothetical protein Btru_069996 [Bulinus truncatus]